MKRNRRTAFIQNRRKKAKFVVAPEDTERKNSPEKKKAVNLTADSDPEALDVEIDVSTPSQRQYG